ncbi:hypothetical protein [Paraburkholderia solisilvae]|uniref:Uncharacterized protein n=1 Tax=Paraburkholderia solisilvae TaxID=624376 RepID=A0A6J5DL13_9BURK|nr:hypothetical protein [Paraburkholderia solisilvae]CAB3754980.1 hypothetical protein LMG29739_02061 [Paraburkholderia solisilvae]
MKKLALCVALAAIGMSAIANERSTLGDDPATGLHENGAALKAMVDHALSSSRKDDPSPRSGRHDFDIDGQPAR